MPRHTKAPPTEDEIKHAYKLYLSKEFTLKAITRHTAVSSYWIYKQHKKNKRIADQLQTKMEL
jgi:hypothetical protein